MKEYTKQWVVNGESFYGSLYYSERHYYMDRCFFVLERRTARTGWKRYLIRLDVGFAGRTFTGQSYEHNVMVDITDVVRAEQEFNNAFPLTLTATLIATANDGNVYTDTFTYSYDMFALPGISLATRLHYSERTVYTRDCGFMYWATADGVATVNGTSIPLYKDNMNFIGISDPETGECCDTVVHIEFDRPKCVDVITFPFDVEVVDVEMRRDSDGAIIAYHLQPEYVENPFAKYRVLSYTENFVKYEPDDMVLYINTNLNHDFLGVNFAFEQGTCAAVYENGVETDFVRTVAYVHPYYFSVPSIHFYNGGVTGYFSGDNGKRYILSRVEFNTNIHEMHVYVLEKGGTTEYQLDQPIAESNYRGVYGLPGYLYRNFNAFTLDGGNVTLEWVGLCRFLYKWDESGEQVEVIEDLSATFPNTSSSGLPLNNIAGVWYPCPFDNTKLLLLRPGASGTAYVDNTGQLSGYYGHIVNTVLMFDFDTYDHDYSQSGSYTVRHIEVHHSGQSMDEQVSVTVEAVTGLNYVFYYDHFTQCDGYWGDAEFKQVPYKVAIGQINRFVTLTDDSANVSAAPVFSAVIEALKGLDNWNEDGAVCCSGEEDIPYTGEVPCWDSEPFDIDVVVPCHYDVDGVCDEARVDYFNADGNERHLYGRILSKKTTSTGNDYPQRQSEMMWPGIINPFWNVPRRVPTGVTEEWTVAFCDIDPKAYPEDMLMCPYYLYINGLQAVIKETEFVSEIDKRDFTLTFIVKIQ